MSSENRLQSGRRHVSESLVSLATVVLYHITSSSRPTTSPPYLYYTHALHRACTSIFSYLQFYSILVSQLMICNPKGGTCQVDEPFNHDWPHANTVSINTGRRHEHLSNTDLVVWTRCLSLDASRLCSSLVCQDSVHRAVHA